MSESGEIRILCVCGVDVKHIRGLLEHHAEKHPKETFAEVVARLQREEQADQKRGDGPYYWEER